MSTVIVYVTEVPGGRSADVAIAPEPRASVHVEEPSSAQVQPVIVPPAGTGNDTAVPAASDGPSLVTVTV